jgi:hypothetical protein
MTNYWILVGSKESVMKGIKGGFAQASHGKSHPLRRLSMGDGIIYYSPKLDENGKVSCQRFTALGCVVGDEVYKADLGNNITPARRNVQYLSARETAVTPLISRLSFIKEKEVWGSVFRFSIIRVPVEDFKIIANAMHTKESVHV